MDVINLSWKLLKKGGGLGEGELAAAPDRRAGGFILEVFFSSWAVLVRSWDDLGAVLCRLEAVLERSWPSWAVLDRSWAVLVGSCASLRSLFGALGASWGDLGASWGGLGAVWGRLGELKTLIFLMFFNTFCKIHVLSKHCHLGRSWAFLRAAWADLGPS